MMRRAALLAVGLLLAACGSPSGGLQGDAALTASTWVDLDLQTGTVSALAAAAVDPAAPCWRDRHILFRRVEAGTTTASGASLGVNAGTGPEDDAARAWTLATCWVAVHELSVAQWTRLAGGGASPALAGAPALGGGGGDQPATGIAPEDARTLFAAVTVDGFRLRLPSSGEWVAAASAGNGRLFAWGDGADSAVTASYMVCLAADGSCPGLQPVGGRSPAATGFCDMHGNAWEIVDDGAEGFAVRGGACDQPALQCRTSNRVAIPADLAHPAVGVRPVLCR